MNRNAVSGRAKAAKLSDDPTRRGSQDCRAKVQLLPLLVLGGLILIIAVIGVAYFRSISNSKATLPIIGAPVSDFLLTNQDGAPVALKDLRGKVWVADVIFTRCPGPCPTMTKQMAELQAKLPNDGSVELVTFTSDPDYDSPAALKKWAVTFEADPKQWIFLTGPKKEIRSLEVNDLKFAVVEKPPGDRSVPDDLFIHSLSWMLVDKNGCVRGWTDAQGQLHANFDSTDPEARAQIMPAIDQLLRER